MSVEVLVIVERDGEEYFVSDLLYDLKHQGFLDWLQEGDILSDWLFPHRDYSDLKGEGPWEIEAYWWICTPYYDCDFPYPEIECDWSERVSS